MTQIICGVDVSARTLDARIGPDGPSIRVARSCEGVTTLAGFCAKHGAELVAMEATGGYEQLPFAQLWQAGLACAILNPRSVRRFAEALGYLEKTDRIDAGIIAHYADVKKIVAQRPAGPAQKRLAALVTRLRQLTRIKVAQSNQRRLVTDETVLASIEDLVSVLRRQIAQIEADIATLLKADPLWRQLDETFRTIAGVADRTVANLMAEMPEIGTISNKAAAKLAGLAPLARDSGQYSGRRSVRGGRTEVRAILYVIAAIAGRHEADFIAFRERLLEKGKPAKVVRVALAHKLLVRLNAKARDVRQELGLA